MRAPRVGLVLAAVVGLIGPLAGSASAGIHRTVVVTRGVPRPLGFIGEKCGTGQIDPGGAAVHVPGPGKPPSGRGSIALRGPDERLFELFSTSHLATALTSLSYWVYGSKATAAATIDVLIEVDVTTSPTTFDELVLATPVKARWQELNPLTAKVEVTHADTSTFPTVYTDEGKSTYTAYLTGHPGAHVSDAAILSYNCGSGSGGSGPADLNIDDVRLGFDGSSTTYNFEPDPAVALTAHAPHSAHRANPVAITGLLTRKGGALAGQPVALQARPKGSKTWLAAGTIKSTYNGRLYSVQLPSKTTEFRWAFAGTSTAGAVTSKPVTVRIPH